MSDPRVARILALYRAGTATDGRSETPRRSASQEEQRARAWRAELARSLAQLERRRRPHVDTYERGPAPATSGKPGAAA